MYKIDSIKISVLGILIPSLEKRLCLFFLLLIQISFNNKNRQKQKKVFPILLFCIVIFMQL
jgi:hypothetical protein